MIDINCSESMTSKHPEDTPQHRQMTKGHQSHACICRQTGNLGFDFILVLVCKLQVDRLADELFQGLAILDSGLTNACHSITLDVASLRYQHPEFDLECSHEFSVEEVCKFALVCFETLQDVR